MKLTKLRSHWQSLCYGYSASLAESLLFFLAFITISAPAWADPPPGTGVRLDEYGDRFEQRRWRYNNNNPKLENQHSDSGSGLTNNIRNQNNPLGRSANGRWIEGTVRGQPDIVRRVRRPIGGLRRSRYALRLQTRNSGTPGVTEGTLQQDDLLNQANGNLFANRPLGKGLSVTTRIYLPKLSKWEDRNGCHLGFRVSASGHKANGDLLDYWPGIWICFNNGGEGKDHFRFSVRANNEGNDVWATEKTYTRVGWWTLGMSFNADGSISYYASPGVDDLTAEDLLVFRTDSGSAPATYKPYGIEFDNLDFVFFSLANIDGQWSTEFVIDDLSVYEIR
ncbi:MAG: hypothetical protein F6J93_35340 [Oscillatoria sp. SIO1A7]|nr:hypothetical protein [Oscillatoria sp. SIO1A7]